MVLISRIYKEEDEDFCQFSFPNIPFFTLDQDGHPHGTFQNHVGRRLLEKNNARGRTLAKNVATSRSSSQFSEERGPTRNWTNNIKTNNTNNNMMKAHSNPNVVQQNYRKDMCLFVTIFKQR